LSNYYENFINFGGGTVKQKPAIPDYRLMIGEAETLKEQSVQITVDMLPSQITDPAKDLYKMSNDDIHDAIANGDLTTNDFNLNTAIFGAGVMY